MRLQMYGNQPIIAPRDPVLAMEVATKNYVDMGFLNHAADKTLHLTTEQSALLDGLTVELTELNYLENLTGNVQVQLDSKVDKSGSTMTGPLVLSADPGNALEATTKQYTDNQDALKVNKSGDTMTGFLVLSANPTSALHASPKQYVDSSISAHASNDALHLTTDQNAFIDAITVSAPEVNRLSGVTNDVQPQLDSKLPLAGGTMTGNVVLVNDPTIALHPATKQYTDAADALKVAKAGDTMTGPLVLSGAPTIDLQASTKKYVDDSIITHTSDVTVHISAEQNSMLDSLTVGSTEINQLSGISGNVQSLLDTKFDKAGGAISGDVTLAAGKTVFVSKIPATDNELVNKAYVDSLVSGREWKDPVSDINLVNDSLSTPPATPLAKDVYIIGAGATGAWLGKEGYATFWDGAAWVMLQARAVAAGDRFGIAFDTATVAAGGATGLKGSIVTIVDATPGAITYSFDDLSAGASVLIFDPESSKFGQTYTRTDEGTWTVTNTSVNITTGDALGLNGNTLSVLFDQGLELVNNKLTAKLADSAALAFNAGGEIQTTLDGATLTITSTGLKISDPVQAAIADRVSKTLDSTVSSTTTYDAASSLVLNYTPETAAEAVNKGYTDAADTALQNQITTIGNTVATLNTDPVTMSYVNQQDATKVSKAGDTMTGYLVLNGDPTNALHPATKQYVDSGLSTHVNDAAVHLTADQNTLLDALTVTSTELNYVSGVTSPLQTQVDAKLPLAGGTMTGHIALVSDPSLAMHPATKQYTDVADALKVAKAGDTMTGPLVLSGAPTANLHATTKQYTDSLVSSHALNEALHMTAGQNTFLDAVTVSSDELNYNEGLTANVQDQLDSKLNKSGGTMSGAIILSGDPLAPLNPATKQYTDAADVLKVAKAGDTMTGPLVLSGAPVDDLDAATKKYVDDKDATQKTYVDTQDALKVAKAGDTMTGALILHADPSVDLQASTKKYVDDKDATQKTYIDNQDTGLQNQITVLQSTVSTLNADPVTKSYVDTRDSTKLDKAGGVMTGYISLHADPSQAMHPTTKQYVDAIAQGLTTKPSIRLATTENIAATYNNGTFGVNSTLTGSTNGALSVDGKVAIAGDRILVKDQTNAFENGDYVVQQVGDVGTPFILKRIELIDESSEVPGSYFYVYDGNTQKGTGWVFTVANPITFAIGTDAINVNQFSGQGSMIGGAGLTITGNTINVNTANPSRIVVNADSIDLATTSIVPGFYFKTEFDGYGRAINGVNPTTIAGFGIVDAQPLNANLTSLSNVATFGVLVRANTNEMETRSITTAGIGLAMTNSSGADAGNIIINSNATAVNAASTIVARDANGDFSAGVITAELHGIADEAVKLVNPRNFTVSGDATAVAVSFDGTANVDLAVTLANTTITPNSDYTVVQFDSKGRAISGSKPNTIAGLGITDVYDKTTVDSMVDSLLNRIAELELMIMSRI